MSRLPLWQEEWEEAEAEWDLRAAEAAHRTPLRTLISMPQMVGITPETAQRLKWKSLKWMVTQDHQGEVRRGFLTHPFRYFYRFVRSLLHSKSYRREGDFFLYGVTSLNELKELLQHPRTLLVLGFSYCHKPFECPSGRFSPNCIRDPQHMVCQQCFIGKALHAGASTRTIPVIIPTVHHIGGKIFEVVHSHPDLQVIFLITACEMTLEMFGDWGNMAGIRGAGIRLDGRICNTMKAFELSEQGIKPGLTVVKEETKRILMQLLRHRIQIQPHREQGN